MGILGYESDDEIDENDGLRRWVHAGARVCVPGCAGGRTRVCACVRTQRKRERERDGWMEG